MGEPADVKKLGWHQGAVLSAEHVVAVLPYISSQSLTADGLDAAWLIVVSQDCDIVHGSFEVEPYAELVVGRIVDAPDPVKMHGRNPRMLHLTGHDGETRMHLSVNVHEKVRIERALLCPHAPCAARRVDSDDVDVMAEWLAKRYTRAAFPDAFNDRLVPGYKRLDKALKKSGELVTGIFLALSSWDELPEGQVYEVLLRVTSKTADLADAQAEKNLAGLVVRLKDAMNSCDGVSVIDAELMSEAQFTLDDLRVFAGWDFDFRSHSGEPGGEIVPRR